jgi:regulator of protease activity HflC (stomatin/prohibitin superfamily)
VPLNAAADAFATRDASGRLPIVVVPERPLRLRIDLFALALGLFVAAFVAVDLLATNRLVPLLLVIAGVVVAALGVVQSLLVMVPEGTNALLARRGRFWKMVPPGRHFLLPWVAVTHLVTRREIPFDVSVDGAPTSDLVRATVDTLITFTITEPERFVYNISAGDFDHVLQAMCQDGIRQMVRQIAAAEVPSLTRLETTALREALNEDIGSYGVRLTKINIPFAQPPADFVQSNEARQLAVLRLAEQAEQHTLTLLRLKQSEELRRQQLIARAERRDVLLRHRIDQAILRRELVEREATNEALRLARMEERLNENPAAARLDWDRHQLEVARALAGNARATPAPALVDDDESAPSGDGAT